MQRIGIIAGSGFDRLTELDVEREFLPETPWGMPSAPLQQGRLGDAPVLFLSRHGHGHAYAPHAINYRANVQALADAGADAVLAVYTVGGISRRLAPGTLVVPHDIVDYSWGREHSFSTQGRVIHVDFSEPFDGALRAELVGRSREVAAPGDAPVVDGGVYACSQGPRLETAAEIDRMERDGCTVVGMTGMPEAGLARELGLPLAGIALVVNPAAGRGGISMEEITAVAAAGRTRIVRILAAVAARHRSSTL